MLTTEQRRANAIKGWKNKQQRDQPNLNNPANWADVFKNYDNDSAAGVGVTPQTLLALPTMWKGVNLIANDIADMGVDLWKRITKNGKATGKENQTNHNAYRLLNVRPNQNQNAYEFLRSLAIDRASQQNAYAYIARTNGGAILELIYLDPSIVMPKQDDSGLVFYELTINGNKQRIEATDILHIRGAGNLLQGNSLPDKCKDSLSLGIAMQKYQAAFFKNAPTPRGYLKYPKSMKPDAAQKLQETFDKAHSGCDNYHKSAVLTDGGEWVGTSIKPVDTELTELRDREIVQHANMLSMPPHKLGSSQNVSYASLEIEQQAYLDDCISPICAQMEAEFFSKLLTEDEKDSGDLFFKFPTDKLLRATKKERYDAYRLGVEGGFINRQEVRDAENLDEAEGLEEFYISQNVKPANEDEDGDTEIQLQALNGIQVTSLLSVLQAVTAGTLPKDSCKALINASFPLISQDQINKMVDSLQVKPEPPPLNNNQDGQGNQGNQIPGNVG